MKTPIQEFIDDLQHTADNFKINNEKDKAVHASLIVTVGIAQSLLEKEKDVIIASHINGQSEFDTGARSIKNDKLAEQYYNETFNTKEK